MPVSAISAAAWSTANGRSPRCGQPIAFRVEQIRHP
jgi:hypothetical protein